MPRSRGYDIQKTGAGATQAITLSAIGSTVSSETEIQVLGGVNSIEPDVIWPARR